MSKRTAAYQLTAENFDDEEEQDDSDKANDVSWGFSHSSLEHWSLTWIRLS